MLEMQQAGTDHATAAVTTPATSSRGRRIAAFGLHYVEMCLPMCIGFAIGDLIYFAIAVRFGYGEPFTQLPELSLLVVTVAMTAPMAAWMLFRRMPRRATAEMAAAMPVLAALLLLLGWVDVLPMRDLVALEHGLMMPAMLVPMIFRLDLYTSAHRHGHRSRRASGSLRAAP